MQSLGQDHLYSYGETGVPLRGHVKISAKFGSVPLIMKLDATQIDTPRQVQSWVGQCNPQRHGGVHQTKPVQSWSQLEAVIKAEGQIDAR